MALHSTGLQGSYDDAYAAAVESLDSGRAIGALETLIAMQ
jgi:anthranilate phosphoribosyltransferase